MSRLRRHRFILLTQVRQHVLDIFVAFVTPLKTIFLQQCPSLTYRPPVRRKLNCVTNLLVINRRSRTITANLQYLHSNIVIVLFWKSVALLKGNSHNICINNHICLILFRLNYFPRSYNKYEGLFYLAFFCLFYLALFKDRSTVAGETGFMSKSCDPSIIPPVLFTVTNKLVFSLFIIFNYIHTVRVC